METVRDYINAVRALLQDTQDGGQRYTDDTIRLGLQFAFTEAYRIRPDMFVRKPMPDITTAGLLSTMPVPMGYQSSWVYYAAGHCQLQDNEDTQDARASTLLNKFTAQLLSTAA